MKIDIICNDGSPLGVTYKSIYGDDGRIGIGGAELTLMTMCEEWTKRGYEIVLYNDPTEKNVSPFEQRNICEFWPQSPRDILIIFRSPNPKTVWSKGYKVWWSHDQSTRGDFKPFSKIVNKIICVSEFHKEYFKKRYDIEAQVIPVPVRVSDYKNPIEKVVGRCIWTSVPDRGLEIMGHVWPIIKKGYPEATLCITSDYRLWGAFYANNEKWRTRFMNLDGIIFLGGIKRPRLIEEQLKAQLHPYTCTYEELFCQSIAESEVAGAYPVTTNIGALSSTNFGTVVNGSYMSKEWPDLFASVVIDLLKDQDYLCTLQKDVQRKALVNFNPSRIVDIWDKEVFEHG